MLIEIPFSTQIDQIVEGLFWVHINKIRVSWDYRGFCQVRTKKIYLVPVLFKEGMETNSKWHSLNVNIKKKTENDIHQFSIQMPEKWKEYNKNVEFFLS